MFPMRWTELCGIAFLLSCPSAFRPVPCGMLLDTVIRGATVVDGGGNAPFTGDVGIEGGRITAVGGKLGAARREIDAQAPSSPRLGGRAYPLRRPGHLGPLPFPFHPAWRDHGRHGQLRRGLCAREARAARLAHQRDGGVEDIPGSVLSEGIQWAWESFPEYLDAGCETARALDVGTQVPHSAVRTYVMGERGVTH